MENNNTGWIVAVVVLAVIIIGGIAWASMQPQDESTDGTTNTEFNFIPEEQPNQAGTGSTSTTASTSVTASTTLP